LIVVIDRNVILRAIIKKCRIIIKKNNIIIEVEIFYFYCCIREDEYGCRYGILDKGV